MNKRDLEKLAAHLEMGEYEEAAEELALSPDEIRAVVAVLELTQARSSSFERAIALVALTDHTELDDFFYERILDKAGDDRE